MRIYYQGPEAVVTSDFFVRRGAVPDTFEIRDLRDVCICIEVRRWQRPRWQELRADYRGQRVSLYISSDERVFNQVRRALLRALENLPPPMVRREAMAA